jgi:hypothetical protein
MMARVKVIRTYRFLDKDPVCDELRTLVQDAGLYSKDKLGVVAILATLSKATLHNLFFGGTRNPQNRTVMAIATSLGYERRFQRTSNRWDYEEELAKAREFIKQQAKLRAKHAPKKKKRKAKRPKKQRPNLRLVA